MLYGPLYYREDNEVADEDAVFVCAKTGEDAAYDDLPDDRRIGRVGLYYPTDGREPFGGMEAVRAVVADYMAQKAV